MSSSLWLLETSAKERFKEFLDLGEVMEGGEVESLVDGFDITDTGEGNIENDTKDDNDDVASDCWKKILFQTRCGCSVILTFPGTILLRFS